MSGLRGRAFPLCGPSIIRRSLTNEHVEVYEVVGLHTDQRWDILKHKSPGHAGAHKQLNFGQASTGSNWQRIDAAIAAGDAVEGEAGRQA